MTAAKYEVLLGYKTNCYAVVGNEPLVVESFERGSFACWGISRVLASGGRGDSPHLPIRENHAIDVPNVN